MFSGKSGSDYEKASLLSQLSLFQEKEAQGKYSLDNELGSINEEEAWHLANNGYRFPPNATIGSLSSLDLLDLTLNPAIVSLQTYKDLQLLNRDQLLRKSKGLQVFYPNIISSDIFFYLTRGWLPNDITISSKLQRYHTFEKLLDTTKKLFFLLFDNAVDFSLYPNKYPNIERVLLLYDEMLGFETTIYLISKLTGIHIVGITMEMQNTLLYGKLYAYIKAFATQTPKSNLTGIEPITLEKSIGMNEEEWNEYILENNHQNNNINHTSYETRTDYIMNTFYKRETSI